MKSGVLAAAIGLWSLSLLLSPANAAVIPGPLLNVPGSVWTTTGLGFHASDNSLLTGFTYQNQGQADTIVLTDAVGNILHSIATPAATPSDAVIVAWALSSGGNYFLLQTVASNELYQGYGAALPSDADIAITLSGTFDHSIAGAVSNSGGWGANQYWAAFNNITTNGSIGVPEPITLSLFGAGLAALVVRRRRKKSA